MLLYLIHLYIIESIGFGIVNPLNYLLPSFIKNIAIDFTLFLIPNAFLNV